jgi:hypothetical protein
MSMAMIAAGERIVRRLGGTWSDGRGMCRCPAHEDRTPSLSVRIGRTSLLFKCFAGCTIAEILGALRSEKLHVPRAESGKSVCCPATGNTEGYAVRLWREGQSVSEGSEIYTRSLEEKQLQCQSIAEQRQAIECMRDYAAEMYRAQSGWPWSPAKGTRASSASSASQIAAIDFLRARQLEQRERHLPQGPVVVVTGPADWHDWQAIWSRLDAIHARVGIHMTALAPGQFRTDWAGRSMDRTPRSIADYDMVMDPIRAARQAKSGQQPGDPARAAQALLALVEAPAPPTRLFLGDDALGLVEGKMAAMEAEIAQWRALSRSTSFTA